MLLIGMIKLFLWNLASECFTVLTTLWVDHLWCQVKEFCQFLPLLNTPVHYVLWEWNFKNKVKSTLFCLTFCNFRNELVDSKSAAGIEKTQTIFLEGEKIIRQAVKAGIHFKSVYTTEAKLLEKLELGEAQQYITKVKALKSWVSQKAIESDGIICGRYHDRVTSN